MRHSLLSFRLYRGLGEIEASSAASFESLGPPRTKGGKAHRPKRRKVRPIKPCSFTHTTKGAQPLAEIELSLLQVVWQRNQVQIFNQPLAPFACRFRPNRLPGQIEVTSPHNIHSVWVNE